MKLQVSPLLLCQITLVYPDKSCIADCYLKEVILERLPGTKIFSVYVVISVNLVSSIYTIHEMVIHVNEIGNLKALKWLVSKCLFYPFILFVWPLSHPRNSYLSINKCHYK